MNAKELFQKEVLEDIRTIAKELSQIQSFSGLLAHQQKIQSLYEKYIFLKQMNLSKYQRILDHSFDEEERGMEINYSSDTLKQGILEEKESEKEIIKEDQEKKEEEVIEEIKVGKPKEMSPFDIEIERIKSLAKEKELKSAVKEEKIEKKIEEKPKGITPLSIEIAEYKPKLIVEEKKPEVLPKEEKLEKAVVEEVKKTKEISPINIEIAEIKPIVKGRELNPIKLDFNDSIAFISQLFKGNKADMDIEFKQLNETQTIGEAKKWIEEMFHKYDWKDKEEFVERLSGLIIHRFE